MQMQCVYICVQADDMSLTCMLRQHPMVPSQIDDKPVQWFRIGVCSQDVVNLDVHHTILKGTGMQSTGERCPQSSIHSCTID